jgi:exopolysaccharide biosynthesis predicted pyruvyltransferase EpsI/glycosyltransferase involved in cell wall biosynthesis
MVPVPASFSPSGEFPATRRAPKVFSGRVIFDHLQKTAGMAINRWLRSTLGDGCASPNLITDHGSLIARYGGRYSVLTAHVTFDGRGLDPRYQYVTLLREPIDRMVSWLHYVVSNYTPADLGDGWHDMHRFLEAEGAIDDYAPTSNLYVRHFASIEGNESGSDDTMLAAALSAVERYDVWGLYDSMPEFLEDFASLLGMPAPPTLAKVNVTKRRPTVAELTGPLRQKLTQLYALDSEFYAILKGRHAEARRRRNRATVAVPAWEPLQPPRPRSIARNGFTLHAASIQGGENHAAGELLDFDVTFSLERPVADLAIRVVISDSLGNQVFATGTRRLKRPIHNLDKGSYRAICTIVANLPEGEYSVGFRFRETEHDPPRELATFDGLCTFQIGRPVGAASIDLPATIRCVAVDASALACGWRLGATDPRLASVVGRVEGGSVVSEGRAGHLLFGPYKSVIAGRWTAIVEGLFDPGAGRVRIDVASHAGQTVHAVLDLTEATDRAALNFELAHPVHDLEIRVWVHEFATARIDAIAVEATKSALPHAGGDDHGLPEGRIETVREAAAPADPAVAEAESRGNRPAKRIDIGHGTVARGADPIGDPTGGSEAARLVVPVGDAPIPIGRNPAHDAAGAGEPRQNDARDADSTGPEGRAAGSRLRNASPTFSIVIATDGRAAALAELLDALPHLQGPAFEVCVVRGPTEDGVERVLERWRDRIKTACNPFRNLSISRNLGLAMAAGDIVAFLDDDAIPDADWLVDLAGAFSDPRVACAGGINRDRTGEGRQYGYATANRMGHARWDRTEPADALCLPDAMEFPYTQGTNTAIRRADLEALGGFDEEYDFYLDETDLCCRLVDAGRLVRQLPRAFVHHRSLPSAIRTAGGVTHSLHAVLKNKLYFSLVNNHGHHTVERAIADFEAFVEIQERRLRRMAADAEEGPHWLERFASDVARARTTGLARGHSGLRRLMSPGLVARHRRPFLPMGRRPASGWQACTMHRPTPAAVTTPARAADGVVEEQRSLLRRTWAELLPAGTQVALALHPDHRNVGDAAIWWGTCSLLQSLGVNVRYECGPSSYAPDALAGAHPDGPILLLGGGNLGDVYGDEQGLRIRILRDFADRPIIQLPQSIWFRSAESRDATAALLARCRDATLMLRDSQSLAFARTHFPVRSLACPDAAMALDLTDLPHTADMPIVALWRRDIELDRPLPPLPAGSIEIDWQDEGRLTARERTLRGCRLLARGRVVITNRLHAHLLCTLLGIPHVVCDTVNGKLSAYRDTWTTACGERADAPPVRFAPSPEEAVAIARSLLDAPGADSRRAA